MSKGGRCQSVATHLAPLGTQRPYTTWLSAGAAKRHCAQPECGDL